MSTLVRRQPPQPRARFAPRSPPRFARRAPASPAQARGSPFADALTAVRSCFAQVHRSLRRLPRTAGRDAPGTRDGAPAEPARTSPGTASRSALRTAAAQSPRRLRSAGFTGVDLPIFHTARIDYPTGRAGLGFHTPRIADAGAPRGPLSCPFGDFGGQPGSRGCWTERHANAMRGSSSPRPRESPPVTGALRAPCATRPAALRTPCAVCGNTIAAMRAIRRDASGPWLAGTPPCVLAFGHSRGVNRAIFVENSPAALQDGDDASSSHHEFPSDSSANSVDCRRVECRPAGPNAPWRMESQ